MSTARILREATKLGRSIRGHHTGRLLGWSPEGQPLVDYPENPHGPIPARIVESVRRALRRGARVAAEVLLVFDGEQSDLPIIVELIDGGELEEEMPRRDHEVLVDGRRVEITAAEEIVLRCGEASICLRSNGRLILHGTYVESDSEGINRLKGGVVRIN